MNEQTPDIAPWRDPMMPGAPLLPQPGWSIPPYHRWTFQHMREMTPTAQVWRGPGPVMALDEAPEPLGGLRLRLPGCDGSETLDTFLDRSWTDGFLVLHRGRIVFERYMNGMIRRRPHLSMSVAKSIAGTVAGILNHRGVLDLGAPVPAYLPELAATAYRDATVQNLLDMTSGVVFDESYDTPGSHMQKLGLACAWGGGGRSRPEGWPETIWQLVLTLAEQDGPHGQVFRYRSIETDVLGFLMERATGLPLAELVSEVLWAPMGAEEDAAYTVDLGGFALADGGFNATLRDYGRYGQLLVDGGRRGDRQIVPEAWIEACRFGRGGRFEGIYAEVLPGGGYHNKIWQVDRSRGSFVARGIYGQFIFVDPQAQYAAVKLSTWPTPLSVPGAVQTIAAFQAIGAALEAA